MATQRGKSFNFADLHLVIFPGFRVDGYDTGGISGAWVGPGNIVTVGPDNIDVNVSTGLKNLVLTVNLLAASNAIDFIETWFSIGDAKALTLVDANSTTFFAEANARPEQRSNFTFSAANNPYSYNILCPNFSGQSGALKNA